MILFKFQKPILFSTNINYIIKLYNVNRLLKNIFVKNDENCRQKVKIYKERSYNLLIIHHMRVISQTDNLPDRT